VWFDPHRFLCIFSAGLAVAARFPAEVMHKKPAQVCPGILQKVKIPTAKRWVFLPGAAEQT